MDTTLSEININEIKQWINSLTKRKIKEVANKIDATLFFDRDFKEDRKNIIRNIKNLDNLDQFLERSKSDPIMVVTTDIWESIEIEIELKDKDVSYNLDLLQIFGHPIQYYDNQSNNVLLINYEILNIIQDLVPKKSAIHKALNVDNIQELYIEWYFKNYWLK